MEMFTCFPTSAGQRCVHLTGCRAYFWCSKDGWWGAPQSLAFKTSLMSGTSFHERFLCPCFVIFPGVTPANAFSPLIGTISKPKTQFRPSLASWTTEFPEVTAVPTMYNFQDPREFCFRNFLGLIVYFLNPVRFIHFFLGWMFLFGRTCYTTGG